MLIKIYMHIQGGLFGFNDCSFEQGKMEYHTSKRAQSILYLQNLRREDSSFIILIY